MARPLRPAIDRVLPRLVRQPDGGCWLWPGAVTYRDGYGIVGECIDGRWTNRPVHRIVWEAMRGPIPDGMQLDHLCRVRLCANPDHLEVVTHAENMRRVAGDVCPNGHPRTTENVRINANGARICLPCRRAAVRRHRERSRERQADSP